MIKGMEHTGPLDVQKGKLMKTFFNWGKYFHISLEVVVTIVPSKKMNIFHFVADDHQDFKYPALWVTPDKDFLFEYDVYDFSYNYHHSFDPYKRYKLEIWKFEEHGYHKLQILVDGDLVYESGVVGPDEVSSIKYYLSDPFADAFTTEYGKVENVMVISDEGCEYQDPTHQQLSYSIDSARSSPIFQARQLESDPLVPQTPEAPSTSIEVAPPIQPEISEADTSTNDEIATAVDVDALIITLDDTVELSD